jgi:hypothetical protein
MQQQWWPKCSERENLNIVCNNLQHFSVKSASEIEPEHIPHSRGSFNICLSNNYLISKIPCQKNRIFLNAL